MYSLCSDDSARRLSRCSCGVPRVRGPAARRGRPAQYDGARPEFAVVIAVAWRRQGQQAIVLRAPHGLALQIVEAEQPAPPASRHPGISERSCPGVFEELRFLRRSATSGYMPRGCRTACTKLAVTLYWQAFQVSKLGLATHVATQSVFAAPSQPFGPHQKIYDFFRPIAAVSS